MGGTDRGGPHGVCVSLLEKNADLLEFTPERAHILLQGVYGDFPHHN